MHGFGAQCSDADLDLPFRPAEITECPLQQYISQASRELCEAELPLIPRVNESQRYASSSGPAS